MKVASSRIPCKSASIRAYRYARPSSARRALKDSPRRKPWGRSQNSQLKCSSHLRVGGFRGPRTLFAPRWRKFMERGTPDESLYPVPLALEMEAEGRGHGARRHVVRSAESGKEVVERLLVGQVDHGQAGAPLVLVAVEEIVVADGDVEQAARRDARRVVVVVFGAGAPES